MISYLFGVGMTQRITDDASSSSLNGCRVNRFTIGFRNGG